eukprot:1399398-Pyramimonas_sp.AAC.1
MAGSRSGHCCAIDRGLFPRPEDGGVGAGRGRAQGGEEVYGPGQARSGPQPTQGRAPHGIFSRQTNQTQEAQVYSHDGPIRCRKRRCIFTTDQSDAGSAGVFSQRTNQMQEAQVYSHDGPIRRRKRRCILTTDQSDAGSAGVFSRRTNERLTRLTLRRQSSDCLLVGLDT